MHGSREYIYYLIILSWNHRHIPQIQLVGPDHLVEGDLGGSRLEVEAE